MSCLARGRILSMVGRPYVSIRGRRIYQLVRARDMFGVRGDMVRWEQNMRVKVTWARCPREIDTKRARRRKGCQIALRWTTGRELPMDLFQAVIRRAQRSGTPPRRRTSGRANVSSLAD